MKNNLFLPLTSSILLLSCHSPAERKLAQIDVLLYQHPDSAFAELKRFSTDHLNRNKDKCYYGLLFSAALDKNYVDVTDDSLINLSARYYEKHGSLYNKMRSHYYQGVVRMNAKRYPAAFRAFEEAEQEALAINDLRHLGLIFRNMGNMFNQTGNFIEAKRHNKKAQDCFIKNNDTIYAQSITYSLAVNYMNNTSLLSNTEDLDSCQYYLKPLLSNKGNPTLQAYSSILYACTLVAKRDSLEKAISLYRAVPLSLLDYQDLAYCAIAFAETGQLDSATLWMNHAYHACHTRTQHEALNSLLFKIDTIEGRYKEALDKVIGAMAVQDSVTRVRLQQSLSVAQKEYYQQEVALQKNQILRQRMGISAICIIALLTILSFLLLMQNRKKLQENLLKEQMAQLAITRQIVRKENGTLVGALFMEKTARLFGLSLQYYEAKDDVEKAASLQEFKNVARELENEPAFFDQLENNLNLYCSGIMDKLNKQVPEIKGNNRKIIALFFAGIPDPVVQILMRRNSLGSLRTLRTRFRQTIKKANATDESLFLDMLETEKQAGKKTKE